MSAEIAAIIDDHELHPERGRCWDRINANFRQNNNQAPASNLESSVENNNNPCSTHQLSFLSHAPGECPKIEGSIIHRIGNEQTKIDCKGHLVSLLPDDSNFAVVVIEICRNRKKKLLPCLCPVTLIDGQGIDAVKSSMKGDYDGRKLAFNRAPMYIKVTSTVAQKGRVRGHLLTSGPKSIKGRVVDTDMVKSIEAGCLRLGGDQSSKNYYTLDRLYSVQETKLRETLHVLKDSAEGIQLHRGSRVDAAKLIRWGSKAILFHLSRHRTIHNAVSALHHASSLPRPSIKERMLQLSMGGNPNAMMVGKFLPCQGDFFNAKAVCACGYKFHELTPAEAKGHTRCRCRCGRC